MARITKISVVLCVLAICVFSIGSSADADEVNKVTRLRSRQWTNI